jgi:YidC/Oxa1 family membrane protein insertase
LLNDDRDRDMQRAQMIGLVLMTVMVVLWSWYFMPAPVAPPPAPIAQEAPAAALPTAQLPPDIIDAPAGVTLPPVAEQADPAADEIALKGDRLELVFTKVGARLKRANVLLEQKDASGALDRVQLVPESPELPDTATVYPLGLRFSQDYLGEALDVRRWDAEVDPSGRAVTFTLALPPDAVIKKKFFLTEGEESSSHVLNVDVSYTNTGTQPRRLGVDEKEPAFSLDWGPNVASGDVNRGVVQEIVWRRENLNNHLPTADLTPPDPDRPFSESVRDPEWIAVKSAYFVVALKPEFEGAQGWVAGTEDPHRFRVGMGAPRAEVMPSETLTRGFRVYLGPTQLAALRGAWPGLHEVLQFFTMQGFGFMDTFAKFLLSILHWFYNLIPNYGLAIIFLTILVRMVLFPLTIKSMRSMKKMQKLQPEMERIKGEVGEDQREMQRRMMELYRERGVNPLGGCFPMLLQMPVFIALYRMLWSAYEMRRAPFALWIKDLSEPDALFMLPTPLHLPFGHATITSFNLLPFLMGGAMLLSTRMMPTSGPVQNPQQKLMMNLMPVIFSVFCYNMASGLNLYILTSTMLGIAQNYFIHVSDADVQAKKPKTKAPNRSRHFYTAAQARKREAAKEARREKKQKTRPEPKGK